MDETAAGRVIHLCVFLAIVGAILVVGWNEPLRYRFMSEQEIDAVEHPAPPPATPVPERRSWLPDRVKNNPLDNRPYHPAGAP